MKYITAKLKDGRICPVLFPGNVGHKEIAQLLGNPEILGAGYVTLPENIIPRAVGFSPSLKLGPTQMDNKLIAQFFKLTSEEYPHNSLFDSLPMSDSANR